MKKKIGIFMWSAILLFNFVVFANVLYTDLNTLAKYSYDIIEGKVIKVEQKWDDQHKFIYTFTTIQVTKSYKAKIETEEEITLKEIGGSLDGFITDNEFQPRYKENENVLTFLQREGTYYRTYGLNQGKFNIETSKGEKKLTRTINVDRLTLLNKETKKEDIKNQFEYKELVSLIIKSITNGGGN